jgi:hypothetical protein
MDLRLYFLSNNILGHNKCLHHLPYIVISAGFEGYIHRWYSSPRWGLSVYQRCGGVPYHLTKLARVASFQIQVQILLSRYRKCSRSNSSQLDAETLLRRILVRRSLTLGMWIATRNQLHILHICLQSWLRTLLLLLHLTPFLSKVTFLRLLLHLLPLRWYHEPGDPALQLV